MRFFEGCRQNLFVYDNDCRYDWRDLFDHLREEQEKDPNKEIFLGSMLLLNNKEEEDC